MSVSSAKNITKQVKYCLQKALISTLWSQCGILWRERGKLKGLIPERDMGGGGVIAPTKLSWKPVCKSTSSVPRRTHTVSKVWYEIFIVTAMSF